MSKPDRLLQLQKYDIDDVQHFLACKSSSIISEDMQTYILQLDSVCRLMHHNRLSVKQSILQLRREWPDLTVAQARGIYYDALDYFYFDDSSSAKSWDAVYADQLEDLKMLAIKADKYDVAYKCIVKAHELRTKVRESEAHDWKAPVFLINVNVKPEDLGFASQKLADIAKRAEDREIAQMINGLETTDKEKEKLMKDAGIKDVEYKKVEEDDTDEQ